MGKKAAAASARWFAMNMDLSTVLLSAMPFLRFVYPFNMVHRQLDYDVVSF
jgi:hypothetical protein